MNPVRRLLPGAVFAFVPTLLVATSVRSGEFLFGIDVVNTFYYLSGMLGRDLASGRLPLWESSAMCGFPVFASMQSGALYPPNWLLAVLEPGPFWTLAATLHLSLMGFFSYAWMRRGLDVGFEAALFGGLVLMLSGFVATHLFAGHTSLLISCAWLPGLLWRLERLLRAPTARRGFLLAGFLAAMILAGFPQIVFIGGLALGARMVHSVLESKDGRPARRRAAGWAAAALGLGVLLAAPQLLPTIELIGATQRAVKGTMDFAARDSLPPVNLATFFAPALLGDESLTPYWGKGFLGEFCGFTGVSTLALAAFGAGGSSKQRRLWVGVALTGLVLALGSFTPVFGIFFRAFPAASFFRVPARYLLLFTMGISALAAMGVDRLWRGGAGLRRSALWIGAAVGILLLAAAAAGAALGARASEPMQGWRSIFEGTPSRGTALHPELRATPQSATEGAASSLYGCALVLGLVGAACAGLYVRTDRGRAVALGLSALAAVELLTFDVRYYVGYPVHGMDWPPNFVSLIRKHPARPFRITNVESSAKNTIGRCQRAGLDHVGGYDPMMLRRYADVINVALGRPASMGLVVTPGSRPHPLFNLLGVRFWILPQPMKVPEVWSSVGALPDGLVFENPEALPRAFLVPRSVTISDAAARLRMLADRSFDPRAVVVLEDAGDSAAAGSSPGTVTVASRGPGRYDLESESTAEAWLVLTEVSYPGWQAEIDGRSAEIRRADHLVQAVRVPAGRHTVRFRYHCRFLGAGIFVALAGLGVASAAALFHARRSASAAPPQKAADSAEPEGR